MSTHSLSTATSDLRQVVKHALEATPEPSNYTADCFVTSELGYCDVIAKCMPASSAASSGAYVGVGPCQNLSYVGALRPRVAVICDSRLDNLLEHLIFKVLVERASDPLDYLLRLFSRRCADRPAGADLGTAADLIEAFDRGVVSSTAHRENSAMLRSEMTQRWDIGHEHLDRVEHLYGQFFSRQLEIFVFDQASTIADECPTLREIILATTSTGRNFHFLTDASRFRYVQQMHRTDRIIPVVGNLCEPESIAVVNDLLGCFGEVAETVYLSNIEDHILSRYVLWPDGSVTEPNPDGLITGEHAVAYARLVDSLAGLRASPDAILARFFYPGARWGRSVGALPYLESSVCRLRTFLSMWSGRPASVFDTYL